MSRLRSLSKLELGWARYRSDAGSARPSTRLVMNLRRCNELRPFDSPRHQRISSRRNHALVGLLLLNGLLGVGSVRSSSREVSVERGHRVLAAARKGGRRDLVPLTPRTMAAVDQHLDGRRDGPSLLENDGGPVNRFQATEIVRRLSRAAGITKHISTHSRRHTAVTLALDAGVPLVAVCDQGTR